MPKLGLSFLERFQLERQPHLGNPKTRQSSCRFADPLLAHYQDSRCSQRSDVVLAALGDCPVLLPHWTVAELDCLVHWIGPSPHSTAVEPDYLVHWIGLLPRWTAVESDLLVRLIAASLDWLVH